MSTQVADIEGIGQRYGQLLYCAGVDTVRELAALNGTRLRQRLVRVNASEQLVEHVPTESMVVRWVARARGRDLALGQY